MKLLRATLISLSGLLVATALAAPGVIGSKVEGIWKQQLARLQDGEVATYRRGWFGAEASTDVATQDGSTQLHSEIQHGPLLFTARGLRIGLVYSETRLSVNQLAPALRAQLERFYGHLEHSPLLLESFVGADNRVVNHLRLEPFTHGNKRGEVDFKGAQLLVETDYQGTLLNGSIELGALQWSVDGREKLYLQPARGEFHYGSGSGAVTIEFPLLRAESESGPLEMRNTSLRLDAEILGADTLKLASDLNVPEIQSATPASSLRHLLTLPQIRTADLQHYVQALLPALEGSRDWPRIMQRPLQLQQQLAIESANGPILADMEADWRGIADGARPVNNAPNRWLLPLTGTLTFSAAEQALMQSPLIAQAMNLRQYGLLLENNGELQMHLQVADGRLSVNGQQLPPELFLLALMSQF